MEMLPTVPDRSAYVVEVAFFDELGVATIPISAKWKLTDGNGDIVNAQENNTITPAETAYISTSGLDNDYAEAGSRTDNTRVIVVESTYLSSLTGTALPSNKGIKYMISDLPAL